MCLLRMTRSFYTDTQNGKVMAADTRTQSSITQVSTLPQAVENDSSQKNRTNLPVLHLKTSDSIYVCYYMIFVFVFLTGSMFIHITTHDSVSFLLINGTDEHIYRAGIEGQ